MSIFRSYFKKNNTLINNSFTNTGLAPYTELYFGSANDVISDRGFSRYIFDVDLTELINIRNNIVTSLNDIGTKTDQLGSTITGASNFLNIILGIITTIETISVAVSTTSKIIPSPPGVPGFIPAALNDAQTFIRKTTFEIGRAHV